MGMSCKVCPVLSCPVLGEQSLSSVRPSRSAPWGCRVRSALCYCALCLVTVVCPSVQECSVGMSCKVCPVLSCPVLGEPSLSSVRPSRSAPWGCRGVRRTT